VLWIATDGKGLYSYDGQNLKSISGVANIIVNSVFAAVDNSILIGTPNGLDVYKDGALVHHPKLKDQLAYYVGIGYKVLPDFSNISNVRVDTFTIKKDNLHQLDSLPTFISEQNYF
jgi:hypothetical protein